MPKTYSPSPLTSVPPLPRLYVSDDKTVAAVKSLVVFEVTFGTFRHLFMHLFSVTDVQDPQLIYPHVLSSGVILGDTISKASPDPLTSHISACISTVQFAL